MLPKIFVKTPAAQEDAFFYGQINNIQLNINMKLNFLIPLRFDVYVKLALSVELDGDGLPL